MTRSKLTKKSSGSVSSESEDPGHNRIELVGRVAAAPMTTRLPSGDEVIAWRLVVDRPNAEQPPYVDTLDCAAWSSRARRSAAAWTVGDVVSVEGALRRRFWRGPQGPRSRYEVEVHAARRLRKGES